MKGWMKYLIIGWSIVSVGVVIVTFQLMKSDFIKEDYEIMMVYKVPEKVAPEVERIAEYLFSGKDVFDSLSITKQEFVEKMKKAKGITIESKSKVKDKVAYLGFPIYAFLIWGLPILVFSLVGIIFGRGKVSQPKGEPGK